jgi:hypothetical protein
VVVGAVSYTDQMTSFSSWGPVRDGRLKPEVCAVGSNVYSHYRTTIMDYYNGTSMACPGTSGTIALLFEHYRKVFSKEPDASTLKAVLCNTATDYGNPALILNWFWEDQCLQSCTGHSGKKIYFRFFIQQPDEERYDCCTFWCQTIKSITLLE